MKPYDIFINPEWHCIEPRWYCKFMFWRKHGTWFMEREFITLRELKVKES